MSSKSNYTGILFLALLWPASCFLIAPPSALGASSVHGPITTSTSQIGSTTSDSASQILSDERRKILLTRKGPYFNVERDINKIEFGATANLVTELGDGADSSAIEDWLRDERSLALSIWDPELTKDLGNNVYRLQTMSLKFVTLQLAPTVDLEMKTIVPKGGGPPTFMLKSVGFDPNIQILPGMKFDATSLGIVIETAGILRQGSREGTVAGLIAFQTTGRLPPPLRIVPEGVLRSASDSINQTIVKFAVESFERGAKQNFRDFLDKRESEASQ